MMAAASAPGLDAENRQLRAEIEQLNAVISDMRIELDSVWKEFSSTNRRVSKLEKVRPSRGSLEHLDKLELEIKKRGVPGVTFKAAAELLGIDRSSVSKLSSKIKDDPRFSVRFHGKKKVIELL